MFAGAIDIGTKNIRSVFAPRIVRGRGLLSSLELGV
jgi:hypothetical protein